jgi:hypothetical protein
MSARFRVDFLHPGEDLRQIGWMAKSREEWFVGPDAGRHLGLVAVGCALILVVFLVAGIVPLSMRLSDSVSGLPALKRDLAARGTDLDLLRSNLGALSEEARRQVRWADLLVALAQQIPPTLKLQNVGSSRVASAATPSQQPGAPAVFENTLRLEAVTPMRAGSQPLIEVAQFMAGLMRDPAVNKRFQLRSWDIKPAGDFLNVSIMLADRVQ